jgi:hypothetical protein
MTEGLSCNVALRTLPSPIHMQSQRGRRIAWSGIGPLFCVFFLIAFGLGYPILNRFDPRQTPGLSDVKVYAAIVSGTTVTEATVSEAGHVGFRVLIPWIARPFYLLARGRIASWDPVMFGLLIADSLFVAGTAAIIVLLGTRVVGADQSSSHTIGVVGALLYLVNFAVPNLRLVGLVDAGEGFFLLAVLWCLVEGQLWALPAIGVLGTMSKESFIPFSVVLTFAWWLVSRFDDNRESKRESQSFPQDETWILASWVLSLGTMIGLQRAMSGQFISPLQFGVSLHLGHDYWRHFGASLRDRNLWYIFLWLLPTAIPNLKNLSRLWLISIGATCATAFVLDAYYGGAPGTVGRALFSIAGPALSLSSAMLLLRIAGPSRNVDCKRVG